MGRLASFARDSQALRLTMKNDHGRESGYHTAAARRGLGVAYTRMEARKGE